MNMHSAEDKSSLKTKLQQFFNPQEYICFKALQYFQKKENGGYSAERIRENLPFFAAKIVKAFKSAGISPFSHYRKYGTRECINPSNAFNTLAYLKAKAQALNQAGHKNNGRPWDANAIAQVLARKQVSALEHFLQFAGRGPNEVPYGLTPKGEIPAQFVVGRSEQVSLESYSGKTIELTPVVKTAPKDAKPDVKQKAKPLVNPKKAAPKPEPPIPPAKDYFSAPEYFAFKALQYFQLKENGGLSPEQIRADLPKYVNFIFQYFQKLNLDPWDHYRKFGSFEGINPSNAFDTISYLQAKAVALNKAGKKQGDKPWDAQAVAQAFRQANTTALEHFLRFAGKGPGEVEHGLTEDGQIPEDFAVPDVLHVPRVPLFKEQVTEPPKKEQPVPPKEVKTPVPVNAKNVPSVQSSGRRAVELKPETDDLAVKDDHDTIPEYYFNLLPKKTVLQGFVVGVGHNIWHRSLASRLILLTVILPGIFIFFYLLFWATPAYISETKFAVRGQSNNQSMEGFSAFFNLPNAGMSDSYIVLNYIQSLDMFTKLDRELNLKEHYSDQKYDLWYRLAAKPTQEDIQDFWDWALEVSFDPDTSILTVAVKAFTPEMALAVCQGILRQSEELVNAMNDRARHDAIAQSEREVARAEERIRKVRESLHSYREQTVILDPEAVATGLYNLVNKLEGDVARTSAELSEAQTFMSPGSPRVKQLENRLAVLQRQLANEKRRLAGKIKNDQSLNDLLSRFQALTLEEEFAQKQLTSAMSSLETARVRADAQSQYVEAFQRPMLADQSLYPRPVLFSCIYMITALLLLGLTSLIVAAVREHAGF